jgi:hypothetical protein
MVAAPAVAQSLPPVPTPSLPAIPTVVPSLPKPPALPTPALPSAPSVPGVGSQGGSSGSIIPTGGSGGVSGGGGSSGTAGRGGRAAGGGSRSGGSGAASSAPRAGGGNRAATGGQGGSGSATVGPTEGPASPREQRAETRRDRRLRANVRPLEGCVGALRRAERRVLRLRAGLGDERPHTRRRVAQILRVSTRRVSRLERRGVRRLRGLVRAGRCSGDGIPAGDTGGGTIPTDQAATLGALAATGFGAGSLAVLAARELKGSSGTRSDRIEVKSERKSSGRATPAAPRAEAVKPPPPAAILERGGADLTLPLLILVAVGALVFVLRSVRRSGAP